MEWNVALKVESPALFLREHCSEIAIYSETELWNVEVIQEVNPCWS